MSIQCFGGPLDGQLLAGWQDDGSGKAVIPLDRQKYQIDEDTWKFFWLVCPPERHPQGQVIYRRDGDLLRHVGTYV